MTKEEAMKQFAYLGAVWFGNSKQHFAFSAYCRLQGWTKRSEAADRGRLRTHCHQAAERAGRGFQRRLSHQEAHLEMDRRREGPHGLGSSVPELHREAGLRELPHRHDVSAEPKKKNSILVLGCCSLFGVVQKWCFEFAASALFALPGLCFIQEADVASHLQFLAFQPDGALVVLAVLGIVDSATFPLVFLLGQSA